jgi:DNA-binding response OmpR family regulator
VSAAGVRQPIRVIVVEDDDDLREDIIVPMLRDHGFETIGLATAAELFARLKSFDPAVIVLDVGLPDDSGFAVARRLRRESAVGIVMLTGLREEPDQVRGLANGADAYLAKPVSQHLLIATLRSVVRRLMPATSPSAFPWQLEAEGWRLVTPNDKSVDLTAMERTVMMRLLASIGTPVPRETLISDLAFGQADDFDPHRLDMVVHRLRRRVAAVSEMALPLRAVRGLGYVITPDIA